MNRNKYDEISSEYHALLAKQSELWEIRRNLGYIELEKPIHRGWDAEYTLREDISRREDSWIFEDLIESYAQSVHSRDGSFLSKGGKGQVHEIKPWIRGVWEEEYDKWIPQYQKLWEPTLDSDTYGRTYCPYRGRKFICTVPEWYFKIKISKSYVTHYKEHDEVLEQEDAWIHDRLWGATRYGKFSKMERNYYNPSHWWRNHCHRKKRYEDKREIHKFIKGKEPNFSNHKGKGWW